MSENLAFKDSILNCLQVLAQCTNKYMHIAATNQKVAEQNWHSHQKNDAEDIGSWTVEKSALVEDDFKIKFSS